MGGKGTYGATPVLKTINQVYDDDLKMKVYSFEDNYDFIWYNLDNFNINRTNGYSNGRYFNLDDWKKRFFNNKTFYMWIKPNGTIAEEKLFTFQYTTNIEEDFRKNASELIICSDGKIGYSTLLTNTVVKKTTNTLKFDEWNLVGVKIYKEENSTTSKAMIFLNDECTLTFDISEDVTQITNLLVANQNTTKVSSTDSNGYTKIKALLSLPFKICMMSFGSFDYTLEDINAIYKEGLQYLVNVTPIQKATGVSYYNSEVYKDFDVITLNGSLESTRGNKPVALMQTDSSFKVEKSRIFKYDPTIQRHVYGSFDDVSNFTHGNKSFLAYKLNLKDKGAISLWFKADNESASTTRYILTNYFGMLQKSGIYISSSSNSKQTGTICFERILGIDYYKKTFNYNIWNNIILFFGNNQVVIYMNGECIFSNNMSLDFENCTTYIGSAKNGSSQLNGYVEMFAYSNKEMTNHQMLASNIWKNGKTISIRKHLDSLGRVTQKVIQTNKSGYKTTYSYDKLRVNREIEPGNYNYVYQYDEVGNIIKKQYKIKDVDIDSTSYQYDQLSRLIKEIHPNGDIETFTYDENGNILTHQIKNKEGFLITNEKYYYSITIKDQLNYIVNLLTGQTIKEYKYENSYKGNPTAIITNDERKNLVWEGRQLKQVGDVSFTYNEDGIRVKKLGTNFVENYTLEGNRIIKLHRDSESGSYDMFFNYDEQGEITGLSFEGQEYFYIRDITGNITKIVDEDGRYVVSYDYDAWGNFKKTIHRDCYVSHRNPFVYKGYFFDEETNWFYLKSRYYDPSIRRFINADDFENFLKFNSIYYLNGINLSSYCFNNPINYIDSGGNWPKSIVVGRYVVCFQTTNVIVTLLHHMFLKWQKIIPHSLPKKGVPGSVGKQFMPDGTLVREREYGQDGNAVVDHDHHPGEAVGYDHDHDWTWDGEDAKRGPAREPESNKFVAALGLITTGITLVWLVGNDVTGVGAADDALIPATASAFVLFWAVLTGKEDDENKW